jgi:hypothetical protein
MHLQQKRPADKLCLLCVVLDSILVYLSSINHRAKLTAKVVDISSVIQLCQKYGSHITKPSNQP